MELPPVCGFGVFSTDATDTAGFVKVEFKGGKGSLEVVEDMVEEEQDMEETGTLEEEEEEEEEEEVDSVVGWCEGTVSIAAFLWSSCCFQC